MSSKSKCNFVALSLQLVKEEWNTNCTYREQPPESRQNPLDESTGKDRPTETPLIFFSFRTSQKVAVCSRKMVTQFKYGLIGDTHSEVTIIPLEDLDFLQHQFFLPGW